MGSDEWRELWARARDRLRRAARWSKDNIPPGIRSVAGLILIVGGIFGFLPILGFWMVPLGLFLIALDLRLVWQLLRGSK